MLFFHQLNKNLHLLLPPLQRKRLHLEKRKRKLAFLESFEIGSDENEEESASDAEASSEPITNPQRDLFGNSGFDSQEHFPGIDDL
jgi:hypothetical protein